MIVCLCLGLNERTVREHIRAGAGSLEELSRSCGAGADCAMCHERLLGMILEEGARRDPAS